MSVTPTPLTIEIHQGASLIEDYERKFYPYEVEWDCGRWVKKCSGQVAPDADMVLEDYSGCSAIAVMVPVIGSMQEIETLSTDNSRIILDGGTMRFRLTPAETAAFAFGNIAPEWTESVAFVYVTRPSGVVEAQYFVTFKLSQGTPTVEITP